MKNVTFILNDLLDTQVSFLNTGLIFFFIGIIILGILSDKILAVIEKVILHL
jgi:hypothetical protein